jgi:DNA-binding MarR family transcriptional regulator
LLRKSARVEYASLEPQDLMERRIVLTLYRIEESRVTDMAAILGNDVGQVSRALTSLRRAGLVKRQRQRDPYQLSAKGIALGELLQTVAIRREQAFTAGLQPMELFELGGMLANLIGKASAILAEEMAEAGERAEADVHEAAPVAMTEIHSRLHPAVISLATTITRSATLAFKRLAALSNYEWRILANIAYRPSISFMELVTHIDSDKAQVSRTLDPMVRRGLLSRTEAARGEPVRFDLTEEGRRLHDIMQADALRRNAGLVADMNMAQRQRLQSYLDRLITNAAALEDEDA